mmetsp:Transcript_86842/g.136060  ORF Transcript_86842/g.136060 Transcript_86842/m.136060 type:complete len:237 (-) Transcript_86842:93-803(-)
MQNCMQCLLRILVLSFSLVSGARVRYNERLQQSLSDNAVPRNWHPETKYTCLQELKEGVNDLDRLCLVKGVLSGTEEKNVKSVSFELCSAAGSEAFYVCDLKGKGNELRLRYRSKKPVAKSCFRKTSNSAIIEAAVDASACEQRTGGDIAEALTSNTGRTNAATTSGTPLYETSRQLLMVLLIASMFPAFLFVCHCGFAIHRNRTKRGEDRTLGAAVAAAAAAVCLGDAEARQLAE